MTVERTTWRRAVAIVLVLVPAALVRADEFPEYDQCFDLTGAAAERVCRKALQIANKSKPNFRAELETRLAELAKKADAEKKDADAAKKKAPAVVKPVVKTPPVAPPPSPPVA